VNSRFPLRLAAALAFVGALFVAPPASAHNRFELDGGIGYRFLGVIDSAGADEPGKVVLDGGLSWGVRAGYRIQKNGFIFLNYSRQETVARFLATDALGTTGAQPLSLEYMHFGGNIEATRGIWVPFFGFSLGLLRMAQLSSASPASDWAFSAAFDGGLKLDVLPWLHLRLVGRTPITVLPSPLRAPCPVGAACPLPVSMPVMIQAEAQAGLGVSF
jgi:hypothetical protein